VHVCFPLSGVAFRSGPEPAVPHFDLFPTWESFGPGGGSHDEMGPNFQAPTTPTHSQHLESGTKSLSIFKNDSKRIKRDAQCRGVSFLTAWHGKDQTRQFGHLLRGRLTDAFLKRA
jgi:hypothetical protein